VEVVRNKSNHEQCLRTGRREYIAMSGNCKRN
jgi:ribosomal protein L37E